MKIELGDWVQATEEITEDNFPERGQSWTHAEKGGIGHVVGLSASDPDRAIVFFERSRTVCDCFIGENVKRIGGAEIGKRAVPVGPLDLLDTSGEQFMSRLNAWNIQELQSSEGWLTDRLRAWNAQEWEMIE